MLNISNPIDKPLPNTNPDKTILLQSPRNTWGEIRIWRTSISFEKTDDQALQTFAAQGALALERAALAEAQNRAEILEKSDQLKSALLNSVSHELRTPLASIKAAVTGLLSEDVVWDSDATNELLSVVDEETDHLNRLVGNLLDMSHIEAGALNPDRHWNDLMEILQQALKVTYRGLKNIRLQVDIPDDLPLVWVDFLQIERVFVKLLSNSVKYSPPGSLVRIWANGDMMTLVKLRRGEFSIVEEKLPKDSGVSCVLLRDWGLPPGCTICAIFREGTIISPRGDTLTEDGDEILALVDSASKPLLKGLFAAKNIGLTQ